MIPPDIESLAFALHLKPGTAAEYRARHDAIWPEMRDALRGAGILHYEIHLSPADDLLFAFLIRRRDHTMPALRKSAVFHRWQAHMAELLISTNGEVLVPLERMFDLG